MRGRMIMMGGRYSSSRRSDTTTSYSTGARQGYVTAGFVADGGAACGVGLDGEVAATVVRVAFGFADVEQFAHLDGGFMRRTDLVDLSEEGAEFVEIVSGVLARGRELLARLNDQEPDVDRT